MSWKFPIKVIAAVGIPLLLIPIITIFVSDAFLPWLFSPTETQTEIVLTPTTNGSVAAEPAVKEVMRDLDTPWEFALTPEGTMLVTERKGTLVVVGADGMVARHQVPDVAEVGESGLLGMAVDPGFAENGLVYLSFTTKRGGALENRVVRFRLMPDGLVQDRVILSGIPASQYHNGGRIAFGPDGMLYVTTGDASATRNAQNTASLAGKILRVTRDGEVPKENPFGNAVWSYGHRNPQGIAWDDRGQLWSTEHGRSGVASGYDELNLIVRGGNYGWPLMQGDESREGMIAPVKSSGSEETWAPSGLAYADGRLYFAGLRGETLYEARLDGEHVSRLLSHFRREYGRLRGVSAFGRYLYLTTSNLDGRGTPNAGDDWVLRVDPAALR